MKKILCVDVSGGILRCALTERRGSYAGITCGFIMKCGSQPDSELPDEAVKKEFGSRMKKYGIRSKDAVLFIHSPSVITKEAVIPSVPVKNILQYVRLNAADFFPFNPENYVLDVTVTESLPTGKRVRVRALPSETVRTSVNYLKSLGLKPLGIALEAGAKDSHSAGVTVSLFGDEVFIRLSDSDKTVLSRRENIDNITDTDIMRQQLIGIFQRIDDYTRTAFDKSVFLENVVVFGENEKRSFCAETLTGIFEQPVTDAGESDNNEGLFGDLLRLPETADLFRSDRLHLSKKEKSAQRASKKVVLFSIILTAVVVELCLLFSYLIPYARLKKAGNEYVVMYSRLSDIELFSEYEQISDKNSPQNKMDTFNNHFAAFLNEIYEGMPSGCKTLFYTVTEKSCKITFAVPDKKSAADFINYLDSIKLSKPGEITSLKKGNDGYRFTVKFNYTSAMLEKP